MNRIKELHMVKISDDDSAIQKEDEKIKLRKATNDACNFLQLLWF